jgi:hypothetical protein
MRQRAGHVGDFGDGRRLGRRSDHRLVVGSDDRDRDRERDDAAMMIVDLDRVGQRQRLVPRQDSRNTCRQPRRSRSAIPSRRAVESTSAPSDSQLSTVASLASPVVTPASVTPVMVTEWVSVRSTSVNVTVPCAVIWNGGVRRPWLLDDQTDLCRGRHDRRIIGTGNRDGDGVVPGLVAQREIVVDAHHVGQRQRFAGGQEVEGAVGQAVRPPCRAEIAVQRIGIQQQRDLNGLDGRQLHRRQRRGHVVAAGVVVVERIEIGRRSRRVAKN